MSRLVHGIIIAIICSCGLVPSAGAQLAVARTGVYRIELYTDGEQNAGAYNQRAEASVVRRLRRMGEPVVFAQSDPDLIRRSCRHVLSAECLGELAAKLQVSKVIGGEIRWHGADAILSLWLFDRNRGQRQLEELPCEQCTLDEIDAMAADLASVLFDSSVFAPVAVAFTLAGESVDLSSRPPVTVSAIARHTLYSRANRIGTSIIGVILAGSLGAAIAMSILDGRPTSGNCFTGPVPSPVECHYETKTFAAILYSVSGVVATGLTLSLTIPFDRRR